MSNWWTDCWWKWRFWLHDEFYTSHFLWDTYRQLHKRMKTEWRRITGIICKSPVFNTSRMSARRVFYFQVHTDNMNSIHAGSIPNWILETVNSMEFRMYNFKANWQKQQQLRGRKYTAIPKRELLFHTEIAFCSKICTLKVCLNSIQHASLCYHGYHHQGKKYVHKK